MIRKTQLEKHLPDIINKPVNLNNIVVGRIIKYDTMTGMSDIEITEDNTFNNFKEFSCYNIIGISNRSF